MTKKSHNDEPAPERANEIKEELHHLDEVQASLSAPYDPANEPMFGQPVPEGADVAPVPLDIPPPLVQPRAANLNELMAGWWKEAKQMTLDPDNAGDHFTAYAAARGWQVPVAKSSREASR